ncbi:hypothetical protein PanWU01x14_220270 [Parasponia andersonii]|uniref:Uncharacterized protein n=1 Tax=Parasponia andersonii TaxID=3476 RepID=A0A2P5BQ46_PARAD|nr:hypothetical protein PanWU01x14_220270 [Parasponia andersonii]
MPDFKQRSIKYLNTKGYVDLNQIKYQLTRETLDDTSYENRKALDDIGYQHEDIDYQNELPYSKDSIINTMGE